MLWTRIGAVARHAHTREAGDLQVLAQAASRQHVRHEGLHDSFVGHGRESSIQQLQLTSTALKCPWAAQSLFEVIVYPIVA